MTDAVGNVRFFLILGDEGDYFRLRKDGAHTGDLDVFRGLKGRRTQLADLHLQGTGDHLQKPSRSGGALVIHDKIRHFPRAA